MKQVININFQGRVVPIEVTAFDMLKSYTESLNRHFANEEGKEEIINDIENRIGELFQERLKNGATCITDDDVNAIIRSMGRPEEFEDESSSTAGNTQGTQANENTNSYQQQGNTAQQGVHRRLYRDEDNKIVGGVCAGIGAYFNVDAWVIRIIFIVTGIGFFAYLILWALLPTSSAAVIGSTRKKLYRDGDDKLIAGVCSGIGNYFGISAWVPRVLFLLPFLSFAFRHSHFGPVDFPQFLQFGFSPGSLIIYIILWLVIPEAFTTSEKLEMKGEKVDLNSIKNTVMEEMKGVQQRAEKFGKEARTFAKEKGATIGADVTKTVKRNSGVLGDIIATIVKIFVYGIVGLVCVSLIIALFGLGIAAVGIFPLKDFILNDGWESVYAWGTLIFFIGVPIIGIITFLIRRLAKVKTGSRMIRFSSICLWVLGWVCLMLLISSVVKDFRADNRIVEENVALANPLTKKLEITSESNGYTKRYFRYRWFKLEPYESLGVDEDTAYVKNIDVRIVRAVNDSFKVTMVKLANGRTQAEANQNAKLIDFNAEQKDSLLILDKGIAINKHDKFRNQRIVLTVYVPVGKIIRVDRNIGWGSNVRINGPWNDSNDWNIVVDDADEHGWESDEDYIMQKDGLYTLDGRPADEWKHNNNRNKKKRVADGDEDNDSDNDSAATTTGTYRYDQRNAPAKTVDSAALKIKAAEKHDADSIQLLLQKNKEEAEKLQQQLKQKLKAQTKQVALGGDNTLPLTALKLPLSGNMMSFN